MEFGPALCIYLLDSNTAAKRTFNQTKTRTSTAHSASIGSSPYSMVLARLWLRKAKQAVHKLRHAVVTSLCHWCVRHCVTTVCVTASRLCASLRHDCVRHCVIFCQQLKALIVEFCVLRLRTKRLPVTERVRDAARGGGSHVTVIG